MTSRLSALNLVHSALALGALLTLAASPGCVVRSNDTPDAHIVRTDAGPLPDAVVVGPMDSGPPPACMLDSTLGDGCERDSQCDDHCFCNGAELCTAGTCVAGTTPCSGPECALVTCVEEERRCVVVGVDAMCDDGEPCNGDERCDTRTGCRAGPPPTCNDANVCTVDYCEPGAGCVFDVVDGDGDGSPARTCGGMDCNDSNPAIAPGLPEVCDNGIDDNCDGAIDIDDATCTPTNDTCASATDITPAGLGTFRVRGSTLGFSSDALLSCTGSTSDSRRMAPDAVYTFTLSEMRDITLQVEGLSYNAGLILRDATSCGSGPDLKCIAPSTSSVEPVLHRRRLPAGDYAVFVKTRTAGAFTLALTVEAASADQRDICVSDMVDISAGGTFMGALEDHDYVLPCHSFTSSYPESAHRLVIPAGEFRDVTLRATARTATGSASTPYVHLTSVCGDSTGYSECDAGTSSMPAELIVRGLPAGTYYVLVENASTTAGSGSYELTAEVATSTGTPPGDTCAMDVPVVLAEGAPGTIDFGAVSPTPDVAEFCGANRPGYRDGFFTFTLSEERDVEITTTSSLRHWAALTSTCGVVASGLQCMASASGTATRRFVRVPAGTHFLNLSVLGDTGTLDAELSTFAATPRPPNDLCAGAAPLVDGTPTDVDLTPFSDDEALSCGAADSLDAYYTFTLATPRFVTLRAEGATAMSLTSGACGTPATSCVTGGPPQIAATLAAGSYLVAVERLATDAGNVRVRFTTADP